MEIWSLLSCSRVCTTVWLHHMDSNQTLGEKVRWEPRKDTVCCFEQILEAAPHKTSAVQPITPPHLANHPIKTGKTAREVRMHSPMDDYTWTHRCWLTCKILYSPTLCGEWTLSRIYREQWPLGMNLGSVKIRAVSLSWWWWWWRRWWWCKKKVVCNTKYCSSFKLTDPGLILTLILIQAQI